MERPQREKQFTSAAGVNFPPGTQFFAAVQNFKMQNWDLEFSGEEDSKWTLAEFLERIEWKMRENC
ncbi:MAG: hypothetical protein ACRDAX_10110, partial [Propionibacteriaceae bacterium]